MMSITRRDFINIGALSTGTLLLNNLESLASPRPAEKVLPGFELILLATNWGFEGSWEDFCGRIKKDGYDGAEIWFPAEEAGRNEMLAAFKKHNLRYGFLVGGWGEDPKEHFKIFRDSLEGASRHAPLYINCHSGRDHFSIDQNKPFIDAGLEVAAKSNVPVYHETHRSRILYSAAVSRDYLQKFPGLRITFDVSHWCNVHESLLEDQKQTLAMTLDRVDHIHARVGHAEGPQVNDPRAPEWKNAVDAHFAWWDNIVSKKKSEGKRLTVLTEFGPADYMPALPYTRQPVANQWEINVHMLNTFRKRYA